jgi:hypothetical protein
MAEKIEGIDPNSTNPNNPEKTEAPVDPSNTSSIGLKVEQGVIDTKKGISEQSSKWEDRQERDIPAGSDTGSSERYLKEPSPEEINIDDQQ